MSHPTPVTRRNSHVPRCSFPWRRSAKQKRLSFIMAHGPDRGSHMAIQERSPASIARSSPSHHTEHPETIHIALENGTATSTRPGKVSRNKSINRQHRYFAPGPSSGTSDDSPILYINRAKTPPPVLKQQPSYSSVLRAAGVTTPPNEPASRDDTVIGGHTLLPYGDSKIPSSLTPQKQPQAQPPASIKLRLDMSYLDRPPVSARSKIVR